MLTIEEIYTYALAGTHEDAILHSLDPNCILYKCQFTEERLLNAAVKSRMLRLVRRLLEYGADPYEVGLNKDSPYSTALAAGSLDIVEMFKESRATINRADTYCLADINVYPAPYTRSPFNGSNASVYEALYTRSASQPSSHENTDYLCLGSVNLHSPGYYFNEDDENVLLARKFLGVFFSGQGKEATIRHNSSKEFVRSSNISFVTVKIGDAKFCYVALSGSAGTAMAGSLRDTIEQLNGNKQSEVEYKLLEGFSGSLSNINLLIAKLNESQCDPTKICSEKFMVQALAKLFLQYGDSVRVLAMSNYELNPYSYEKYSQLSPNDKTWSVRLSGDLYVKKNICCAACQTNKDAVLRILLTASELHRAGRVTSNSYLLLSPDMQRRACLGKGPVVRNDVTR